MDDNLLFYILSGFLGAELIKKIQDREIILPDFLITCIVFFLLQALFISISLVMVVLTYFNKETFRYHSIDYEGVFLLSLAMSAGFYLIIKLLRLAKKIKKKS